MLEIETPLAECLHTSATECSGLGIALDPTTIKPLNSKLYAQAHLTLFRLKPDPCDSLPHCYLLEAQNPFLQQVPEQSLIVPDGIYAFVILQTKQSLNLVLGQGPHYMVSQRASHVIAAGDIYFIQGFIPKITDQSGSYHLIRTDPAYKQKKDAALLAMQQCGLPMEKFQCFQEPTKPLTFSFSAQQAPSKKALSQIPSSTELRKKFERPST